VAHFFIKTDIALSEQVRGLRLHVVTAREEPFFGLSKVQGLEGWLRGTGLITCLVGPALLYFFARTPSNSTPPSSIADAQPASFV
jgi:hypothetical protein